jgi:hypothetical protein
MGWKIIYPNAVLDTPRSYISTIKVVPVFVSHCPHRGARQLSKEQSYLVYECQKPFVEIGWFPLLFHEPSEIDCMQCRFYKPSITCFCFSTLDAAANREAGGYHMFGTAIT